MTVYGTVLNVLPYFEVLNLRSSCSVYFQNTWLLDRGKLRTADASYFSNICSIILRGESCWVKGENGGPPGAAASLSVWIFHFWLELAGHIEQNENNVLNRSPL